ncbi:hypothetical protein ABEB36_002052 [Hypothenemus hampei]|uniref:ZAD domain-containing protein n=1 Tax=Hypothenemus hampei TaxID=57062 RepID=A0ABD1F712_HYPHA
MPVCRLCFGFVHQKSFLKLTFAYKCIVNNVVPELDLEMVDNSVVCKCCSSKIHEYNEFKITCYEVKQKLLKTSLVNNQIRNCRTCLNPTNNISHVILNSPDVNNIFKICLSEIDFRVSLDSVICSKCHDCLEKFYQFKMSCLQVEERLKNYIKNMNYSNPSIDLEKIKVELETFNEHRLKTTDIKVERIEDMKNVFDSNSSNIKIKEICLKSKENFT